MKVTVFDKIIKKNIERNWPVFPQVERNQIDGNAMSGYYRTFVWITYLPVVRDGKAYLVKMKQEYRVGREAMILSRYPNDVIAEVQGKIESRMLKEVERAQKEYVITNITDPDHPYGPFQAEYEVIKFG